MYSMEAEKKAEYFPQNTVALRKLPLVLQHRGEMGRVHTEEN